MDEESNEQQKDNIEFQKYPKVILIRDLMTRKMKKKTMILDQLITF